MTESSDPGSPPAYASQPPPAPPPYGAPPSEYGAPPPPYGAPPSYQGSDYALTGPGGATRLATWAERAGGYVIDVLIVTVPSVVIGLVAGRIVEQVVAVVGGLILGYVNGAVGQTPGKRAVGVKLIRERDGELLGGGMGMVRWLCHILDSLALLLGWFWPLWDPKRQTFADKLVSTVVIKL